MRAAVFAGILALLIIPKLVFNPHPIGNHSDDGSLYYQVARHVAEGDGFVTSVSLYNAGLSELPHPSNTYALWPILLGVVGYLIGLDRAAVILPEVFYFSALIALYAWTRALDLRVLLWWKDRPILDGGHLLVALFALNPVFFRFTSLPYTEGLAFTLAFATFLAANKRRWPWALTAGILAGLAYLTRPPFIGLILAVPACLLALRHYRLAAWSLAGSGLAVAPWVAFLFLNFTFQPKMLFDTTAFRLTPELAPFALVVQHESAVEHIADRLGGVLVAFDYRSVFSYPRSFGVTAYLVPALLMYVLFRRWRQRDFARLSFPLLLTVVAGLLLLAPVHEFHTTRWGGWFFNFRNGLPLIVLIAAAAAVFMAGRLRWACVVLLLVGIAQGAQATRAVLWQRDQMGPPSAARLELAKWTEAERPLIASIRSNPLGAITRGRFHDFECHDSREQMLVYLDVLGVDYVLQEADVRGCPAYAAIADRLEDYRMFGDIKIWRVITKRPMMAAP